VKVGEEGCSICMRHLLVQIASQKIPECVSQSERWVVCACVRMCDCTKTTLHWPGNDKIPSSSLLSSICLPWLRQPTTRKAPVLLPLSVHLIQLKLISTGHKEIGQERVPFY